MRPRLRGSLLLGFIRGATILLLVGCAETPAAEPPAEMGSAHVQPADPFDGRVALPLLPQMAAHQKENMRAHLAAVQRVVAALARDDLPAAAAAAGPLGSSESMTATCEHFGAAAPGFTELALGFHRTADGIAAAARDGDRTKTLAALAATLEACVGCHAVYRQQIVDEAAWSALGARPRGVSPHTDRGTHHEEDR